jgi:DNA-binding response OmpR family regulator
MSDLLDLPRVLCVDDNAQMLDTLKTGLSLSGFEVITAANGADAAFHFRAHDGDFDCVLTDHHLPDGNGAEWSEILREGGYTGQIVVMSGLMNEKDLALYQKWEISGFFRKPFKLQILVAMLLPSRAPMAVE